MAIGTFSELQSAIGEWLHRFDLTEPAPVFISLAEERFNRTLRLNTFSAVSQISVGVGQSSADLPADFLEVRSITRGRDKWLQVTLEEMAVLRAEESQCDRYAIYGGKVHIPYTASDDVDLSMSYWTLVPALGTSNTTNWLLTRYPGAYLWCSLAEAAIYAVKPQQGAVFENRAVQALAEIRAAERASEYGDVLLKVRPA